MTPSLPLRAICVGRHRYISEHLARFFANLGLVTDHVVGVKPALSRVRQTDPDVVICEYELLAATPLEEWERDELFCQKALVAVSLTRRPHDAILIDLSGIGGFLYLPTLKRHKALRLLEAAATASRAHYRPTPPQTAVLGVRPLAAAEEV